MGLFDGVTGASEEGSTAEIAKLLDLPVVSCWMPENSARSIAAVVRGSKRSTKAYGLPA